MSLDPGPHAALLLIDLQAAIDDPVWSALGPRNNPGAEEAAAELLAHWRGQGWPVWHVRHDSTEPNSPYRPGQPGNAFKPAFAPIEGEPVVAKSVNSAFIGTGLEPRLREAGISALVIAGVVTNNSVEATVRMAGNLGFSTILAEDACYTFPRRDRTGRLWSADEVHALSVSNMDGEYCTAVQTAQLGEL